ncbi:MAG: zinc-ribbon domain-containing protein [Myxococcales bacterium]|nr:zinc-ribbon domain-containing protein [Myxococcales bacterium]
MKVVCESCRAKYLIPDERVAGRKVKIRCRKCQASILVRGDMAGVAEADGSAPPTTAAIDEWHVSIDGEQHGPYGIEQLADLFQSGQLAWDVYVWREGLADWQPASEVQELLARLEVARGASLPPVTEKLGELEDDNPTTMFQSDSFAPNDGLRPSARESFSAAAAANRVRTDSIAPAAVTSPDFGEPSASTPPHQHPRASTLTGERHEDSVLFSTSNLQQAAQSSIPMQKPGYAHDEGSGLIDIRALASLASSSQSSPPASASANLGGGLGGQDDEDREGALLHLANHTGSFGAIDTFRPVTQPAGRSASLPLAIVAAAALVAAGVFGAVYITRAPEAPAAQVGAEQPAIALAAAAAAAAPPAAAAQPQAAPEPTQAPDEAPIPEATEATDEAEAAPSEAAAQAPATAGAQSAKPAPGRAPRKARGGSRNAKLAADKDKDDLLAEPAADEAPKKTASLDDVLLGGPSKSEEKKKEAEAAEAVATTAEPAATKPKAGSRSIDDLLDGAVDKSKAKTAVSASAGESAGSDLPKTPTRDEVLRMMKSVSPKVKACATDGTSGTASAAITVAGPSGRVTNVKVTGIQGPVGSCIAREIRSLSFPKFSKPSFAFNFPFKL